MHYQVEVWHVSKPEKILEALKVATDFGIAIAWVRTRHSERFGEIVDVGLIMPYCEKDNEWQYTHRTFHKKLFEISETETVDGITIYHTPLSPYAPGDGGQIELKDCLYVPDNFSCDYHPFRYSAESVKEAVEARREELFAPYAVGRPTNWSCDTRTKDMVCIGNWLSEELTRRAANSTDRRTQQWKFNRESRSDNDLWQCAADIMNEVLDHKVEQNRKPHHRWG